VWRTSRTPALGGLGALAAYVAFQVVLQQQAVRFGETFARAAGLTAAEVSANPRPASPFNWMVVVRDGDRYDYSLVNLARRNPERLAPDAGFIAQLSAPYPPLDHATWTRLGRFGDTPAHMAAAKEAWRQPQFRFFRWFAQYPVLYRIDAGNPSVCVWFQDLRFFTPGHLSWPFRFGMCREGAAGWQAYQLVGERGRLRVY